MTKQSKDRQESNTKALNIVPILGTGVCSAERGEVLNWVLAQIKEKKGPVSPQGGASTRLKSASRLIVTPNPEIVHWAFSHPSFLEVLNKADLSVPDGVGLRWAMELQKIDLPQGFMRIPILLGESASCFFQVLLNKQTQVVPGRELFEDILGIAKKQKLKVFLLGGRALIAERSADKILRLGIEVGWSAGPWLDTQGKPATKLDLALEKETIKKINDFKPNFLFVAFGFPKQELWLDRFQGKLNAKISMVVGGTLDYFSGERSIPPSFVSNSGFEWAWRLFTQIGRPNHFNRIFTAVVLFPLEVLKEKYRKV